MKMTQEQTARLAEGRMKLKEKLLGMGYPVSLTMKIRHIRVMIDNFAKSNGFWSRIRLDFLDFKENHPREFRNWARRMERKKFTTQADAALYIEEHGIGR